jgi:hypothetical protein
VNAEHDLGETGVLRGAGAAPAAGDGAARANMAEEMIAKIEAFILELNLENGENRWMFVRAVPGDG